MRHRSPVLAAGLLVGMLALTAGTAQAQQDQSQKKIDAKTLQKQCATLASKDAKDNSSMAAPAPTVSDSIRQLCDSVKAAKMGKDSYPSRTTPANDSMKSATPATPAVPADPNKPSNPAVPQGANSPASSATPAATPATPAEPATPADPNKPKADATNPQ